MVRVRKPLGRKQAPKKPFIEVRDLEEDRETIEAFNRSWREMGMEEADLLADADQMMQGLEVKKL